MINAWGITDKGAVRQQNQDGYYLQRYDSDLAVGVVCDGMGGARAGNVASLLAVETFSDILDSLRKAAPEDAALLLREAAEAANSAVYQRACADPDCRGMGTTMVGSSGEWKNGSSSQYRRQPGVSCRRDWHFQTHPGSLCGGGHGCSGENSRRKRPATIPGKI